MKQLALYGGEPIRKKLFPNQACIDEREHSAVNRVLKTQMLSGYRGNAQKYRGGVEVQRLEEEWSVKFGSRHSIAINSCTSALHVACMAIGLKPGDEVIVTPYSMTCSATAPMICGATPVFADVEPDYFCLDYESVKSKITERTKAIIVVDLFGQPFDPRLRVLADKHGIYLIEDAAQAPAASISEYVPLYDEIEHGKTVVPKYTGTLGHIGCFSFTQGKHMTAGEGGMITTNDDVLATKCRLLLNHAEAVVNDWSDHIDHEISFKEMWGLNLRMTETQAAIVYEQLMKLEYSISVRQKNAAYLAGMLERIPPVMAAKVRQGCEHTFYVQAFHWVQEWAEGIHRDTFINAVKAEIQPMEGRADEGVRFGCGYIKPLYRMPVFSDRFNELPHNSTARHSQIIEQSPVVEKLWKDELFLHLYLAPPTSTEDCNDIVDAFEKVWRYREELR
jgi:perosamine synthetase